MDEDLGGIEDLSDEGIARFLRENIGDDIDTEMMEEFRSSNIFDEFLQQLQILPSNSRRASLANSDGDGESKSLANSNEGQQLHEELAVPSTSKDPPVPPKADSESPKYQKKKKKSSKSSTAETPNLQEQREIPKSDRKLKKNKNVQPECPEQDSIYTTAQTSKKNKSSTKLCSPGPENDTVKIGTGADRSNERREAHHRKKRTLENLTLEKPKPIVRVYDLVMMKKIFPNGLSSRVVLTTRLVEEIRCWERQVLSLEASKKCQKNIPVSSHPPSADRSKHSHSMKKVESRENKSQKSGKNKDDKVAEDNQEKKKSECIKSPPKNEVKLTVDNKQKAPSVVSFAKGSNALGILQWAVKPNPTKNDKTAKPTQRTSTVAVAKQERTLTCSKPSESGVVTPTNDCIAETETLPALEDIGIGVDSHIKFPPLQRKKKKEPPSDIAIKVENPVLPHQSDPPPREPQHAPTSETQGNTIVNEVQTLASTCTLSEDLSTTDCETNKNKDNNEEELKSSSPPTTVPVLLDDSHPVECQNSKVMDEQVALPPSVHGEPGSPLRVDQEKNNENEAATLSPVLNVDPNASLDANESKNVSEKGPSSQAELENSISSTPLDPPQESTNVSEKLPSSPAGPEEPISSAPVVSQGSNNTDEKVTSPSIAHLEPESPPTLACQENETEDSAFEAVEESHNLSPDDMSECQDSASPEETTVGKSGSSERAAYKRKNVIESSSDDDIKRIDTDDMDEDREPKKSSDEDQRKSLPFERKRDQADPRSKKFDRFEHERQRKLGEIKKGKEKPKENMALEEVLKEKPLIGSFRIPKRTTNAKKPLPRAAITPLASADVPKENLQFERCRKGADKDKRDKDFNYRGRDYSRDNNSYQDYSTDSGPINVVNHAKKDQEPGNFFRNWARDKDDGRVVVLAPETTQLQDPSPPNSPAEPAEPEPEVQWGNDDEKGSDEEEGGSSNSAPSSDNEKYFAMEKLARARREPKPTSPNSDVKNKAESVAGEEVSAFDPEVPIESPQENHIATGAVYLVSVGDKIDLPNVATLELKDVIVMKLAWWLSRIDPDNAFSVDTRDSICDEGAGSRSFLHKLNFTESDEDELFPRGYADPRKKQPYRGLVDEHCGNALLQVPAKYRTGPGDKFQTIFQVRKGADFDKGTFQAWCTLCSSLVVGKRQLADHVSGDVHKSKMSKAAGVGDIKRDDEVSSSADKKNGDNKVEQELPKADETKTTSSKQKETEGSRSRSTNESRDRKKDEDIRRRDKSDKHVSSSEKRKRSNDGTSDEGGHKSKDEDTTKSGDKSERRHSRSGGNRSRSRSPRHKRTRSRSPRRRSRSPRHGGHRRRSRSIQRIPRSPSRLMEQRERRRSTSAERVQKFLAKTNRRSRSPSSKGYSRKRHRRSRSKSPITEHVLPRRDNREFYEKLTLTAEGKWTDEMEQRWKLMEADQAMFMEQFGEKKTMLNDTPESHPNYKEEWTAFWEKRYTEVQNEGLDPEEYDFVPEWKDCWTKRLRELLDVEYEKGIKEIKEKHRMDLESLLKIRLVKEKNNTPSPAAEAPQTFLMSPPQDLATPSTPSSASLPPSNQVSFPQPNAKGICSNTSGNGDDYTARAMSISDCGDGDNRSDGSTKMLSPNGVAGSKATTTVSDVMSTWAKMKLGEFGQQPPTISSATSVSKSQPTDKISNADSGSIASFDFDGFELTQVLHLMSKLEDQLSFFADKVKEYFKKAEELDLKKKNKSLTLLDDEDFVVMLFNVRDRFMAMIRANVLSKDILKSLNFTIYALNSILDAPQCRKHRSKIASSNVPFEKEIIQPELPKVVNTQPTAAPSVSSAAGRSKTPSVGIPSSTKAKIAVLVTEFLQSMGREDLSDAELRELLRKVVPLRAKNNANASKSHNTLAGSNSYRTNDMRSVTKTCSVVTERVVGSAVPSLTLPDVIVPVPVSAHDRGPLGCREEVWDNNPNRESDNNVSTSESERRCGSPFSRRGFTGNPTSNPFRDKDTLSLQSSVQAERDTEYRISAIDDMLPDKHAHTAPHGHGIGKSRKDPEITLDQVTTQSSRTRDVQSSSREGSPSRANTNLSRLVTGLSYIIMKDKYTKNPAPKKDQTPQLSSEEDDKYYRRERVKKRKRKRERRHSSRSSSTSNASYHAEREYTRKKERKKRKRRKDENKHRKRKSSVVTGEKARASASTSTVRIAPSYRSDDSASLRESNRRNRRASGQRTKERYQTVSPQSVVEVEVEESYQPKSHNVKINMPKTFRLTTWETLSDISSLGDGIKQVSQEKDLTVPLSNQKESDNDRNKVESISKAFWTADAEDNERALSPVSSNDNASLKEPANAEPPNKKSSKPRQYRVSIEQVEKEPGEISDSSGS